MVKLKKLRGILGSKRGGIGTIVAMIVSIILVLGLISYVILGQVAGAKDTGDKAQIEQDKINRMLQDPSIVTGSIVKGYFNQAGLIVKVDAATLTQTLADAIIDGALFKTIDKTYNVSGQLTSVAFTQVNLSR